MNFYAGKTLLWVPLHREGYDAQKVVRVIEVRDHGIAKLENGWLVDESGDAIATETSAIDSNVTAAVFEPVGYVDDCL